MGFRDQKAVDLDQVLDAHNTTGDCVHFLASAGFPSGVLGFKSDDSCALNPTVVVYLRNSGPCTAARKLLFVQVLRKHLASRLADGLRVPEEVVLHVLAIF